MPQRIVAGVFLATASVGTVYFYRNDRAIKAARRRWDEIYPPDVAGTERSQAARDAAELQTLSGEVDALQIRLAALSADVGRASQRERTELLRRLEDLSAQASIIGRRVDRRRASWESVDMSLEEEKASNSERFIQAVGLVSATMLSISLFTPWLPPERIESMGVKPFRGYVLNENEGFLAVLRATDRKVLILVASDKPTRSLCSPMLGSWATPRLQVLRRRRYEACPI